MCKYLVPYSDVTDENGDMKDITQLAVFIRGVNEDFQFIVELEELTTVKGKTCTTKFFSVLVSL
jgi:hypothetical protein